MLYLASRSPRRRELLGRLGLDPRVLDIDIPEVRQPGEPALDYVRRVSREKAGAGLLTVTAVPGALVLAADTEVVLDDDVFGKPVDADDAVRMLTRLSGRTHQVISVVWLISAEREAQAISVSDVTFAALTPAQLDGYIACGEWAGKAGAYAIQGRAEAFVTRLDGSYSGVMGLPVHETSKLLAEFGVDAFAGVAA
ncbi:Maf family protein [Lysobacter claricitrinus]|uniref:Maf family protein n=1 Tax=Lysobacter claricitrinus TaxID=3367728 RepID=UPI0037DBD700